MELVMAIFIGLLFSCGVYLILRRSIVKVILGILVLSNATNLILFISGGIKSTYPIILPGGSESINPELLNDPISQVLALKSIVIGLGISAYILAVKYRYFQVTGTHDLDQLKNSEQQ